MGRNCFFHLIFSLLFFAGQVSAQVVFEKEYTGNISIRPFPGELEPKFYQLDRNDHLAYFYNADHSLFNSLIIPSHPKHDLYDFSHYTQYVFNKDQVNEYIAIYKSRATGDYLLKVMNTEGKVLFKEEGFINPEIVDMGNGEIKMILYSAYGDLSRVYGLQGNETGNWEVAGDINPMPWPNPAVETVNLPYDLPESATSGELTIFSNDGKTLLTRKVGPHFKYLKISTTNWEKGVYFYRVIADGVSGEKKMFVVQ